MKPLDVLREETPRVVPRKEHLADRGLHPFGLEGKRLRANDG